MESDTLFVSERRKIMTATKTYGTRRLVYSGVCLALALVLPFLTGQIPQIGSMLSPMHIPVLLCGFLCGWQWGVAVGFIAPLLRYALFQMPPMPMDIAMAFELAAYGAISGLLYKKLPKTNANVYVTLILSMIAGRIVWGAARFVIAGLTNSTFPFSAFIAGAVTEAIPGIILHIVLIPIIVIALERAKLVLND